MLALVAASTAASAAVAPLAALAAAESNTAQPTITQRVFFDLAACEPGLGSSSRATACAATVPLGRIVVGLYGDAAPSSVALFVQLATAVGTPLSYRGSYVDRILPGQARGARAVATHHPPLAFRPNISTPHVLPSRSPTQCPPEQYLSAGAGLLPFTVVNDDAVRSSSFEQRHVAPGTVSLVLSDPEEPRRPVAGRFRVTTGPGPQPQLDSLGIVVGRVVEGLAVVERVARLPTFTPAGSVARQYNSLAGALGDKRAAIARVAWSRPREAVVVTDCGLL